MFSTGWIAGRNWLVDSALGVRQAALNAGSGAAPAGAPGADVAEAIKRAANRLKAAAVLDDGRRVDYGLLRTSAAYAEYRDVFTPQLRSFDPATLVGDQARLAFWINIYNALIIDAVIAFGVQNSVAEGFLGTTTFFRRAAYIVGGGRVSADDIEHGILRANRGSPFIPGPQFSHDDPRRPWTVAQLDPRIHFALNCASRSCPPIGVYDAGRLDAQLDLAAANFVAHDVEVVPSEGLVRLSSIFRWFADDFGGQAGVVKLLLSYLPEDEKRQWLAAQAGKVRLSYRAYDWGLNA